MNKQNHGEPSRKNIAQKQPISNSSNSNADGSSPNKTKKKNTNNQIPRLPHLEELEQIVAVEVTADTLAIDVYTTTD